VQAARHFGRPVGGRQVVRDTIGYLRDSEKLAALDVSAHAGGERRGPEDLHAKSLEPS
jgi:hypothetical protein